MSQHCSALSCGMARQRPGPQIEFYVPGRTKPTWKLAFEHVLDLTPPQPHAVHNIAVCIQLIAFDDLLLLDGT